MGKFLVIFAGLALASAGVLLLMWVLWLLWKQREEEEEAPAIEIGKPETEPTAEAEAEAEEPAAVVETPAAEEEAEEEAVEESEPFEPDDLKRIEGIGPKISSVLQAAGISTYEQLADANADQLRQILEEEDPRLLRLADPTSWPEQASLAAAGEWEAFEALQKKLKGERRR